MNEIAIEKTMTIQEVAAAMSVSRTTIERAIGHLFPDAIKNGAKTYLTEAQVAAINKHVHSNRHLFTSAEVTTELEMSEMTVKVLQFYTQKCARLEAEKQDYIKREVVLLPKAEVYDKIADAKGHKSVQEVAAILGFGSTTFFSILRDKGILYKTNGTNLPKREHIEAGRFIVIEEPYTRNGEEHTYSRTFVTPKGEIWLAKIMSDMEESA